MTTYRTADPKAPSRLGCLWRYDLPSIQGEGWAIVVLGSDGYFSAVSDYGDYAHLWYHHGRADFRQAVVEFSRDPEYVLGKIARKQYDGDSTEKAVRREILRMRRAKLLAYQEARDEWDRIDEVGGFFYHDGFSKWLEDTCISDASELLCESYSAQAMAFAVKTLGRLRDILRAELAAEKGSAR